MKRLLVLFVAMLSQGCSTTADSPEATAVKRAALDYIESQQQVSPQMMERALHEKLVKRTYWKGSDGDEFVMETNYEKMVKLAASYNKNGDKFPASPKNQVEILDIDDRVASVKLIADDWIDYMHLIKTDAGEWKIVNVLWQYHDTSRHRSR